ncbi:MAG: translation initiation factor [Bacteroidales bacterium]|nr:translation initiation factor [Bacteroidales bacterium]
MGKKQRVGVVYSTDPDYQYQYEGDEAQAETLEPAQQRLVVRLERRGGKPSTMVDGFVGTDDDLADLARMLKNKCGVGGSAKEGVVIIQGDHRDTVLNLLTSAGYRAKRGN